MKGDILHDERQLGFFWVNDDLFDKYAPEIGVYGVAVYCLLARMANGKGVSWPSYSHVAKRLKISRRTAMRAVETLVEVGLVKVEEQHESTPDGNTVNKSNRYTLKNMRQCGASESPPSALESPRVVQESHRGGDCESPKGIHKEGIHNKKEVVGANVTYLDPVTSQCLQLLTKAKGFPRDDTVNAQRLAEYREDFPLVDPVEVVRDYVANVKEVPIKKSDNPRLKLRNFFKSAYKRLGNGRPKSQEPSYLSLPEL